MIVKEIKTDKSPKAIGPYSQGILAGDTFYASGAIGVDPISGEAKEGIEGQAEQALKNIGGLLEAVGFNYSNVVKTTCFLSDMGDFAKFNEIYSKYFNTETKPARSCVAVKTLPKNLLCEIEIIAVKK